MMIIVSKTVKDKWDQFSNFTSVWCNLILVILLYSLIINRGVA